MSIKEKIIKKLGGFTSSEYNNKNSEEDNPCIKSIEPVYADIKSYIIDTDGLIYDKTQLARKIGERMLDNGLIDFSIKQKTDSVGGRIYEVRAKAFAGRF